jgi:quercetin dioxygenase-like cupin family protein
VARTPGSIESTHGRRHLSRETVQRKEALLRPFVAALVTLTLVWMPSLLGDYRASASAATHATPHTSVVPDDLRWGACPPAVPAGASCAVVEGDLSARGALFGFRIKMPDGYQVPAHFHPADEHVLVLSGVFNLGLGERLDPEATRPMPAGSFLVMPKGVPHFVWAKGETILHIYAVGPWGMTYVNPGDDPRKR